MMLQAPLLVVVGILTFGLEVLANSGNAVNEFKNDTVDGLHELLNYNIFRGPDSKLVPGLQTAIQKLEEQESGPICSNMASSALIHTCHTFKGEDDAPEPTEKILEEEKKLFAARLAICELSDTNDQDIIPTECASFVLTETNTKKKGWFGYISANGHEKPVPRFPEYDIATRQDRDRCVAALSKSPQAWSSYSNAKQDANQWCPAVRGDIEKDRLLQMYRAGAEAVALNADALRDQIEIQEQVTEEYRSLKSHFHELIRDNEEESEAARKRLSEFEDRMQAALQKSETQLHDQISRSHEAFQDQSRKDRISLEETVSELRDFMSQHSTDVALARSNDAAETREQMEFYTELLQQRVMQIIFNITSTVQEIDVYSSNARQGLQQFKDEVSDTSMAVMALNQDIGKATVTMQHLQDQQEDMASALNKTKASLVALESQVLVISGHVTAIVGSIAGILDRFPAISRYFWYILVASTLLLLKLCVGGPTLLQLLWSIIRYTSTAIGSSMTATGRVVKRGFVATISSLRVSARAVKHSMNIRGAVLMLFAVIIIAIYFLAVESPITYIQRWEEGKVSPLEFFISLVVGIMIAYAIIVITLRGLVYGEARDEKEFDFASSCNFSATKCHDNNESAV